MGGNPVIDTAFQKQLHYLDVILIRVLLVRKATSGVRCSPFADPILAGRLLTPGHQRKCVAGTTARRFLHRLVQTLRAVA